MTLHGCAHATIVSTHALAHAQVCTQSELGGLAGDHLVEASPHARRARTPVGRTDRILARGGGGRGRSRGRIVDAGDDATRAWGRKRAWEVKRKRPRAVAETRGRKTRGRRRRRRGRERATDRRRGRRSNSCDES